MNGSQLLGIIQIDAILADIYIVCEDSHDQKDVCRPIVIEMQSVRKALIPDTKPDTVAWLKAWAAEGIPLLLVGMDSEANMPNRSKTVLSLLDRTILRHNIARSFSTNPYSIGRCLRRNEQESIENLIDCIISNYNNYERHWRRVSP